MKSDWQRRLDAANMRAQEKTLRVALRLLREAGLDDWRPESASHNDTSSDISAYLCITDLFGKSDWGWVKLHMAL